MASESVLSLARRVRQGYGRIFLASTYHLPSKELSRCLIKAGVSLDREMDFMVALSQMGGVDAQKLRRHERWRYLSRLSDVRTFTGEWSIHDHHFDQDHVVRMKLWAGPDTAGVTFTGGSRFRRKPVTVEFSQPEEVYAITSIVHCLLQATRRIGDRPQG